MQKGETPEWSPSNATALMVAYVKKAAAAVSSDVELHFFGSGANPGPSLEALQISQMLRDAGAGIRLKAFDAEGDKEKCLRESVLFFPALMLVGRNRGMIRFLGAPAGYGLRILADALSLASSGLSGLRPRTADKLAALKKPVNIKVFISPESEYCGRPAGLAARMAAESPLVAAELINSPDFPVLSQRYRVETTPRTIVNDTVEFNGARPEDEFVEKVLAAVVPQGEMYR